jgi:hypothetical protein
MKLALLNSFTRRDALRALGAGACALALAGAGPASAQSGGDPPAQPTLPSSPGSVTATIEQCVASAIPAERSATFTGEMTAVPGAARMAVRVDVQERVPGEMEYHPVSANGLGVWRWADPKVKVYKYVKQVSNLSAPASYRGLVRFRWVNAKGHVIKRAERLTARCLQPAPATPEPTVPGNTSTTSSTPGA